MKRSIIAAVLATTARHILLEEGDTAPGRVRFLSQRVQLADGVAQSWVTLTRTGNFTDPRYGKFSITPEMLTQMVRNFDTRVLGQDVFIDVAHKPSDGAAAKVLKLAIEGGKLRALVDWTPYGVDAIKARGYCYLSAEYHEAFTDNEKQQPHGCVLLGAGLTIRPVIKGLDTVQLSIDDSAGPVRTGISPSLFKELSEPQMDFIQQLLAGVLAGGAGGSAFAGQYGGAGDGLGGAMGMANGASMLSGIGAWMTDFKLASTNAMYEFGGTLTKMGAESMGSMVTQNATAMGTFANAAGYALAAVSAIDAASRGQWGKAIGTGVGAWFGGPIGAAIGGAIGGWVDDAFGGGHEETTGTGITGSFNKSGFSGSKYQDWHNKGSSGFFGFGGSGSSSGTNYNALDASTTKGLSTAFTSIQMQTADFAKSLGLSADTVMGFSKSIRLALGGDAAANKAAIEAMLTGLANDMASMVLDAQYIREGEAASSTLARLTEPVRQCLEQLMALQDQLRPMLALPAGTLPPLLWGRCGVVRGQIMCEHMSVRSLQARMKHWASLAGLPNGVSPHWMRHTRGVNIIRRSRGKNPLKVAQLALGHASISSTGIYTQMSREEFAREMQTVAGCRMRKEDARALGASHA